MAKKTMNMNSNKKYIIISPILVLLTSQFALAINTTSVPC